MMIYTISLSEIISLGFVALIHRMKIKIILLPLLLVCCSANAGTLKANLGASSLYTNTNDPNYTNTNQYDGMKNISANVGLTYATKNKLVFGISTNRIYHPESERTVKNNAGIEFDNRSKLTADSFSIGYAHKRFIPSVFISNVKSQESLYYQDRLVGRSKKTTFVHGASLAYFLSENIAGSVFYVAPNSELNLEGGLGVGVNYYFNLI